MCPRTLKNLAILFILAIFSNGLIASCLNVTPSFLSSRTSICGVGPHTVSFTNTSTGSNSTSSGYQWYLNGTLFANTTGTATTTSNTITSFGTYQYMLVAFDTVGACLDTAYYTVTITQIPTANFNFPSGNICPNSAVLFTDSSTSLTGGVLYFWDFGDGGTDSSQNPTHIYGVGGTYSVTLTVFNSDSCSSSISKNVTVLTTPNINISGDDGDGDTRKCLIVGDTDTVDVVTFVNSSTPGITYTWDFGDGTPNATQTYVTAPDTLTHSFNSYGTFNVICSAIDTNGCTYVDTIIVVFEKYIAASFTIPTIQTSGCTPHSVTPVNTSASATTYTWGFGDGSPLVITSSATAPSHIYDTTGFYTVTLIASNSCNASNSSFSSITVSSSPIVNFTSSLVGRGCSPQNISFVNNSQLVSPTNNFSWDMGNGNTFVGSNPPMQSYGVGTYVIKLVAGNGCGSDSVSQTITIDSLPYALVSVSPLSGCSGMAVGGSALNFGFGTISSWYLDGVLVSSGDTLSTQVFTNTTDSIQNHIIRYNITNHCGSYDSLFTVEVHPEVQAILANTLTLICSGDSLLHQSISSGDSLSYFWSFGDGTTSTWAGPHNKIYNNQGVDSVVLKITGYCGVDSVKKIILIDSLPYATVSILPLEGCSPLIVSGTSTPYGNNTTSTWFRNSVSYFVGANMPPTAFTNNGNLVILNTIRYNISNHCGSFDTTSIIKVHPKVLALMTPVNTTVCVGDSLQFINLSSGDSLTFLWKFSNGDTSTFSGPQYRTFNTPGLDTTWLFVEGYCGKDSTFSVITTNQLPVADILADVDSGCEDLRVNLTNGAPNGANYLWNINGGVSLSYTPSVLFTTIGSNKVYLKVDSAGCSARDTIDIIVFPGPDPLFAYTPLSGCSDLGVVITNTSPVSFGDKYYWSFGNGNTDTVYSPPVQTFVNSSNINDSTYFIKLVVYTVNGCSDSLSQNVTVRPLPKSSFGVSDTTACEKEVLLFQNNSIGGNSFRWYFGDGDSSLILSPSHSYDTAGTYLVTLISTTIWNCQDTSYQTLVINPNPIARFYSDSVCFTYYTTFVDSSLFGPTSWKWNFGDGDSSSVQHPTHSYLKDSVYSVSLHISNIFGCENSTFSSVIVYKKPVANFGTSAACAKKITSFYDSSSANPTSWFWDFGDGNTDSVKNPLHIYAIGGVHAVKLIVENASGCIDSITKFITISTVPKTYFIASPVCFGMPTSFINSTVLGYSATSYFWDFGNGTFSGLQNPIYQYVTPGTYSVSLTVTNINGCDSTFTKPVFVYSNPIASFTHDTVCEGVGTHFIRSIVPYDPNQYVWNYGDGSLLDTNTSSNFYHTYATDGAYSVKLIFTNANGCSDSVAQTIIVRPSPTALFSPQVDSLCLGDSVTFLNSSFLATKYFWSFGDSMTDSVVNPTHSYTSSGLFKITLQVESRFGCVAIFNDTVTVLPNPVSTFISDTVCLNNPTLFTDLSSGAILSWDWNFGDGNTSTVQNPTHVYGVDSSFRAILNVKTPFGCSDSSSKTILVLPIVSAQFNSSLACVGRVINFTDSSSGTPSAWNWSFGDGNIAAIQNPTHIYTATGNYTITLIVSNVSGCSDTISHVIFVNSIPVPNFTADTICIGGGMMFNNLTTNIQPITSYFWDFGDGNSSVANSPSYTYAVAGTYPVTLTVTNNGGCDSSITMSVVVLVAPAINFIHDTVCFGIATHFIRSVSPSNPLYYIWNYGDGSGLDTNVSANFYHTYITDGAYSVTLKVINKFGCEDSITQTIIVRQRPVAQFSPQVDTICLGDSVTFLNSSSFATLSFWDFGDAVLDSSFNPTHVYTAAGLFQIKLQVKNSFGCISDFYDTVIVLPNPVSTFMADTICLNNPTLFTDLSSGSNLSWDWSFGDGNTSTVQNPTHVYGVDSSFRAILNVKTPFGCSDSSSKTILVLPIVSAQFNSSLACVGRVINFTDSSSGTPSAWNWSFGDGNIAAIQNPTHIYTATGNYTITLIVSNVSGCSDTISHVIFVNSIPVPNFTADTICIGGGMMFNNLTTNIQPITSYFWDFGDGNSSIVNNPSYTYATPGVYLVTLTVTNNGGCDSSITKPVLVNSIPFADFTHDTVCVGLATTFNDASSGAPGFWKWNFGDFSPVDSTSGSSVTHVYATAGLYTATLNIKGGVNGCEAQSIKYITVFGGVDASFVVSTPICEGTSVQFVNNSTSSGAAIINTSWVFGDGNTSGINNPIHTYASSGVYRVALSIISNQGCIDTDSSSVVVNALPVAKFDFTKNICLGFPTNFYDSSTISVGSISQWNWSFGDGNADTLKNPFNAYGSPGTYLVNLQVTSDSGCNDVISKNLTINTESVVGFTYNSVCVGNTISFKDVSTIQSPDSIVAWYWEFGDGTNSSLQNPNHQYLGNTQSYSVKLTITSVHGCLNDTTILVSYLPVPAFNYGPQFFGYCEDETVVFYDSSVIVPPTTIVSWEWTFGCGHKAFIQNPSHFFDSAGSYTIKLKTTSSDGCVFYDSLLAPLIIYQKPIADFLTAPSVVSVFRPEVFFDNKTNGALSYFWDFGDGTTATDDFPTHMFPNIVGYYTTVQYAYSAFGCVDSTSQTIYVKDEFTLYAPNAFTPDKDFNKLFIVKGYEINDFHLKIFNRSGELIFETSDETEGWNGKHNGKNCPIGVYIFVIQAKDNIGNSHYKKGHVTLIR